MLISDGAAEIVLFILSVIAGLPIVLLQTLARRVRRPAAGSWPAPILMAAVYLGMTLAGSILMFYLGTVLVAVARA